MKQKDVQNLANKSIAELKKEMYAKRKELTKFNLELKLRRQKNTRLGDRLSDTIARIQTMMNIKAKQEKKV